ICFFLGGGGGGGGVCWYWGGLLGVGLAGCFYAAARRAGGGGGCRAAVADGDRITIDIPSRTLRLEVDDAEIARRLAHRRRTGYRPRSRHRPLSTALRAYALLAQSADKGGVRRLPPDELGGPEAAFDTQTRAG
ncbi:dihydroxy-acid dehydratase, partial [Nocardia farcinica]|uniref:dihydroxy-acid dehydratase domain-containing protein n=1 Tax=Nocardia farcinica TaxID=37329 RepID=UPI0024563F6E